MIWLLEFCVHSFQKKKLSMGYSREVALNLPNAASFNIVPHAGMTPNQKNTFIIIP